MHELDNLEDRAPVEAEHVPGEPLYPGDVGQLPFEARRLLVQLLSGPSLDGRRHGRLWPAMLRYQTLVRSRLADLFLELVLDADAQVAFVRQVDTGELETPILLRRTRLTFLDSALLLFLRQLLADADIRGERAVVSTTEMVDQLHLYEQNLNTDPAGFEKRIHTAIDKAKKNSLLGAIRGTEDRYEISPTLKLLFSAEQIAALIRSYSDARTDPATASEELHEDEQE